MSRLKVALLLLSIGLIFIVLDISITTNIQYPNKYENTKKVIGEYQYYNIASNYGANCTYKMLDDSKKTKSSSLPSQTKASNSKTKTPTVSTKVTKVIDKVYFKEVQFDILSDFVGFLLIIVGCILLAKCSKRFKLAILCAVAGIIVHGIMFSLPFIINGLSLTNASFFIGMIYLAINLSTIFLVDSALLKMIPGPWCRDERKWCKLLWFSSFAAQIVATFTFWLGSDFGMLRTLAWVAYAIVILLQFAFWYVLMRAKDYLRGTYEKYYSQQNN